MNNKLAFFSFVLLLSCTTPNGSVQRSSTDDLLGLMTTEERRIHDCLQVSKDADDVFVARSSCLKGTQYAAQLRMPSASMEETIQRHRWFFDDNSKLTSFYRNVQKLVNAQRKMFNKKTHKIIHDRGFAVSGEAYFGIGSGWAAEFINHGGKFGLFCAPAVGLTSDAGVEAKLSVVQSVACPTNQSYSGEFLSFAAGISGELIGLPAGGGMAYSFGLNMNKFLADVKSKRQQKKLNLQNLSTEVSRLPFLSSRLDSKQQTLVTLLFLAGKSVQLLGLQGVDVPRANFSEVVRKLFLEHKSLGNQLKQTYLSAASQKFLTENHLFELRNYLGVLVGSLTGCDSIGGFGSIGLSLIPASVGISYENYHLLLEYPMSRFDALSALTPLALLNPFLLSTQALGAVTKNAREVLDLASRVQRDCKKVYTP